MIQNLKEQIQINKVDAIGTRSRVREVMGTKERVLIDELERQKLGLAIEILQRPETIELIREGFLTFGMVKPHAEQNLYLPKDDELAANFIINKVEKKSELDILIAQPVMFDEETVAKFYQGNKKRFEESGIWTDFVNYTTSGPVTAMILYDQEGKAIDKWREFIGKTKPEEADPHTIRGRYARRNNLPNNLVHGSGNSEEAEAEINIFTGILTSLHDKLEADATDAPSLENLAGRAGVPLEKEDILFAIQGKLEEGNGWNVYSTSKDIIQKRDKVRIDQVRHSLATLSGTLPIGPFPQSRNN